MTGSGYPLRIRQQSYNGVRWSGIHDAARRTILPHGVRYFRISQSFLLGLEYHVCRAGAVVLWKYRTVRQACNSQRSVAMINIKLKIEAARKLRPNWCSTDLRAECGKKPELRSARSRVLSASATSIAHAAGRRRSPLFLRLTDGVEHSACMIPTTKCRRLSLCRARKPLSDWRATEAGPAFKSRFARTSVAIDRLAAWGFTATTATANG